MIANCLTDGIGARLRLLMLLAVSTIVGCDSSSVDPRARSVSLTPEANDGAAWIRLTGASVASVTVENGQVFFETRGDTTLVVVVRSEPGPLTFDLLVDDPTLTPVGTPLEVSDAQNRLRDPAGYRVVVQP